MLLWLLRLLYGLLVFILSSVIIPIFLVVGLSLDRLFLQSNTSYWEIGSNIFIKLLGVKHQKVQKFPLIRNGFILANHRCFFDFAWDPLISESCGLARLEAILAVTVLGFIGYMEDKVVIFKRGKTNSRDLFKYLLKRLQRKPHRIMFYPEGTRCNYQHVTDSSEIKTYLRYGLLKRIYEYQEYPVQLLITSNKDKVFNEKTLHCQYGVQVKSAVSQSIYPKNYHTFEDFIQKITDTWYHCYRLTHESKGSRTT